MVQILDLWRAPFCSKRQAASRYVARFGSAIHRTSAYAGKGVVRYQW